MPQKEDFGVDCIGAVTFFLDDRLVLQGQILFDKDRHHDDQTVKVEVEKKSDFIFVELLCDAAIVRDNATLTEISPPVFRAGDIVRINVAEIIAVGPSRGCEFAPG
jgi:hypothetical protein